MRRNTNAIVVGSLSETAKGQSMSLAESFLSVDAILVVDMSGSMGMDDAPGGQTRYDAAEAELIRLQTEMPGKIAVVAFSDTAVFCPAGVPERLGGATDLAKALRFVKPADGLARIIVISDGDPDDRQKCLDIAATFTGKIDTVYIGPERDSLYGGRKFLMDLAAASGGIFSQSQAPGMLRENVTRLIEASV